MPSPSLSPFDAAAILIVLAAALGYLNHRFLGLPSSVGLIDELLNAVLFLLIGLEVIAISPDPRLIAAGLAAIPLVLAARIVAVGAPLAAVRPWLSMGRLALPTLVWGGLRGGISIALALSLAEGEARTTILAVTYVVVLFSVIVQGGTVGGLIRRLSPRAPEPATEAETNA